MKKNLLNSLLLLWVFTLQAEAQQNSRIQKPRMVVGIVVDQMRWDYLYRYADRYSKGGFKRLMRDGFNCQATYLNYVPSYTAPGHASIYTGSVPAVHGIVGNDWREQGADVSVYCAQDTNVRSIGGSFAGGQMSPSHMRTSTIGDELRLSSNMRSRVYGVALKDRGAIFPAGHLANAAFWFDDSSGHFMSSSYYVKTLPSWLQRFNAGRWPDSLLARNWHTLYPISSYTQSIADDNAYEYLRKGETKPVFPHRVFPGVYKQIRSLPIGNTLSFMLAESLIDGEKLGTSAYTDMLCLSLSSSDYIGHAYGPDAVEVEDMYLRLDLDLEAFLLFLDDRLGEGNYTVFLTADHGAAHNAAYLKDQRMNAGVLSEHELTKALNRSLAKYWACDSLVADVMNYQILLREDLIEKKKIRRTVLKDTLIALCKRYPEIAYVLDLEKPDTWMIPEALSRAIRNGYYEKRCGSISLIYQPAHYSDGLQGTTHGTWNPYDTHIPLLWYGWGIPAGAVFRKHNVTDIAVTLAALLHIQIPNGAIGEVIDLKP